MKGFEHISNVYFIGIGGIGMSALARMFHINKITVSGYDRTPSPLTAQLQGEGIRIHYEDFGKNVSNLVGSPENTLVILTPAVPGSHGELQWLREKNYTIRKRSQILGQMCSQYNCLAVAGTHGKTTVSTMVTVILNLTTGGCGAILGGISKNFESNLLIPRSADQWMVTEADEYDRSFLQLKPDIAVITSVDADHLDIYGAHEEIITSFREFAGLINPGGTLLVKKSIEGYFRKKVQTSTFTYSLSGNADFSAEELRLEEESGCYIFRLSTPDGLSPEIRMHYPGLLNVENAVAAGAAAFLAGASLTDICRGLEAYIGVSRRFDILFKQGGRVYIDDYAHHPEELRAFITSVRTLYPGRHITGIFQPHLYTRTRDFADEFAKSLDLLDTAVLIPIYPARELPIPGVSSEMLLSRMTIENKFSVKKNEVPDFIIRNHPQVLLTMGAGDIDSLTGEITDILRNEAKN